MLDAKLSSAFGADIKPNHIVGAVETMFIALAINMLREAITATLDAFNSIRSVHL